MRILELAEIQRVLAYGKIIDRMRDAVTAWSRGECDTPMPMHLDIAGGMRRDSHEVQLPAGRGITSR